jgi:adenine-specific DNA-methyltransferase
MGNESFETAFERVKILVREYESNHSFYLSPDYNESQARKDFIDKILIALGWDVNHEIQKNPYEQEVKVERLVATGQSQRSADYACYIAPNFRDPLLFVEAKKPSKDLAAAINCFQTVRYGWNVSTPVAVLSNFEQFIVLDCRYKPDIETAVDQVCQKYHYSEYSDAEKFAKIYYLVSRDAVAAGSLDKYAETLPKRRGKAIQRGLFKGGWQPVDESFLEELDVYRDELARNFKNHNPKLDGETLTEITQRTLDRLVFLRFLEDKIIEAKPHVSEFGGKGNPWHEFIACCRKLDHTYNGIVFKNHDIIDSPNFKVDEAQFADLCEKLAHVNSPYDFNSIPIHILGSIYERFLGKVIVVTNKRAHVELKPEVRKAGGVYYTPNYVVRYIVDNTVGKLTSGKTPAQIAEMRFADISCGSGSFLLAIYDWLLRYHFAWYNDHPTRAEKDGCVKRDDGNWHLSLKQRRKILLNNIYGVDIDHQAVEVAQMSLYLRLLEEETTASALNYQLEFKETILPPLNKNIVCGNGLIGTDVLDGRLFPADEERKLNPMNFDDTFPEIMKNGGFDAVVGNPPYRRELDYKHLMDQIALGEFGRKHRSPRMDLWYYFVHRGLEILKQRGLLSFIVNAYWTSGTGAAKLIAALRDSAHLDEIFFLGKLKVFQNVSGQHMIIRASNLPSLKPTLIKLVRPTKETSAESFVVGTSVVEAFDKPLTQLFRHGKVDLQPLAGGLLAKVERGSLLSELGKVRQGIAENPASINKKTNKKYGDRWQIGEGVFTLHPSELLNMQLSKKEESLMRPYHDLCDIGRYFLADQPSLKLIYSTPITCPDIKKYPSLLAHLKRFRPIMEERRETKKGVNSWWHLHWPRDEQIWKASKIIAVQMSKRPSFSVASRPVYVPFSMNVFVPDPDIPESLNYFAGLLNSKLLWRWYSHYAKRRGVGLEINGNVLARTPIRRINFSNAADKMRHDEIVTKVESMIEAKKQLALAQTDKDKSYYENKCTLLERQIDQLVYELYGLREDEIKIVDGITRADAQSRKAPK